MTSSPSASSPPAWVGPALATAAITLVGGTLLLPDAPQSHGRLTPALLEQVLEQGSPAMPERRCTITVSEEDRGTPIDGATVRYGGGDRFVITGPEGAAELPPGGLGPLVISAAGFFPAGVSMRPGTREARGALRRTERGAELRVRVQEDDGTAVPGAVVSWKWQFHDAVGYVPTAAEQALRGLLQNPPDFAPDVLRGVTGNEGDLSVPLPLRGSLTLSVQHSQLGPLEPQQLAVDDALLARGSEDVTVVYPPSPWVSVRTLQGDAPVPYVLLELFAGGASPTRLAGARTDENGEARLRVRTVAGTYLVARPQELAPALRSLENADLSAPLTFRLDAGATLTVHIPGAREREPLDRALEVQDSASGIRLAAAQPDAADTFRFPRVPTGLKLRVSWISDPSHASLTEASIPADRTQLDLEVTEGGRTP